jgi:transposase
VTSHPDDLAQVLQDPAWRRKRIGLEVGPLSQWLFSGLAEAGLAIVCIETRHTKAFLKAPVNKSDRNKALRNTSNRSNPDVDDAKALPDGAE